jgi:hypothetical protein
MKNPLTEELNKPRTIMRIMLTILIAIMFSNEAGWGSWPSCVIALLLFCNEGNNLMVSMNATAIRDTLLVFQKYIYEQRDEVLGENPDLPEVP